MLEFVLPCAELVDCIEGYWASWSNTAERVHLLPDGRVDVVLALREGHGSAAIHGSVTSPTATPVTPGTSYLGIRFRPGMARHFIVPAMADTQDAVLDGAALLRFEVDRALEARTSARAVASLERALVRRRRQAIGPAARADALLERAVGSRGTASVAALASAFGISPRQVERDFRQVVGMNPKAFLSIQRCLHARSLLHRGMAPCLAAVDAGYADQSHLHRDMRRWAGQTPAACARADVGFLQDRMALARDHGHPSLTQGSRP